MAEVTSSSSFGGSHSRIVGSYFPTIPPKAPQDALSYSRAVLDAPIRALVGVVVDGRQPVRHPVTSRCRVRKQVGSTNRWRLPESLGSDLLGTAQAIKAVSLSYNDSMIRVITAENPKTAVNMDPSLPYTFPGQRPHTTWDAPTGIATSRQVAVPRTAPAKLQRPLNKFTPSNVRPSKPEDVFRYHSKKSQTLTGPDVLLQCLDMNWELHRPFLQKSDTLSSLLVHADNPTPKQYYKNKMSETLDDYVNKGSFYSNDYQEVSSPPSKVEVVDDTEGQGIDHPKHISEKKISGATVISLEITDSRVTKHALAVALGNLYHEDTEVETQDVSAVLAAAYALKFHHLINGCSEIMLKTIRPSAVCGYHEASVKYHQDHVEAACQRWLELNLVPQLSSQIQLRQLPMELLQKVLRSNRLFTSNEYSVYRTLAYWVFLQMNPHIQLMPSFSTVLTYFNSLPKSTALLDREEGQVYTSLFMCLRLHGITDTNHLQDIQQMNVLPQAWVVRMLTEHYQAGGGDMNLMTNFNACAVRQGFIVLDEPHYHSEIMSLHGFHFELKAVRQQKQGCYSFYMQRLKPSDPILSFRQCERHTFSMRPDRDVRYNIRVQYYNEAGDYQMFSTGMLAQRFGLGNKTSKSEVVTLDKLRPSLYVTFSVLFPQS